MPRRRLLHRFRSTRRRLVASVLAVIAVSMLGTPAVRSDTVAELDNPTTGLTAFGYEVARGDDFSVVRAVFGNTVWVYDETSPIEAPAELVQPPNDYVFGFGSHLAADGEWIFAGGTDDQGQARTHVFQRDAGAWIHVQTLQIPALGPVAIDEPYAIVAGGPYATILEYDPGQQSWVPFDVVGLEGSVHSADLDGERFVLGWMFGSADVFRIESGGWAHEQRLHTPDEETLRWSASVAISGNRIAVGNDSTYGTVDTFTYDAGTWMHEDRLITPAAGIFGAYARDIDLDGLRLVVGAPAATHSDGLSKGMIYRYRYDFPTRAWMLAATITAPGASPWDYFGLSVSLRGAAILTGAYGRNHSNGAAFLCHATSDYLRPALDMRIVADILVGVAEGGGGVVFVPGRGPIPDPPSPILPEPAFPVLVYVYPRGLLDTNVERALVALGNSTRLSNTSTGVAAPVFTTRYEDVLDRSESLLLVAATDEPDAVAALSTLRDEIRAARRKPAVLFVEADGDAFGILRERIENGEWE